jgi:integrase
MAKAASKRRYGSGSIIEIGGVYYGKWRVDGTQIKRRIGPKRTRGEADGLTHAHAEARLREVMAEDAAERARLRETRRRTDRHSLVEVGWLYIEYGRDHRGLKASTLADYDSHIRIHIEPYFAGRPIDEVSAADIEAFDAHLRAKRGSGRRGGKPLHPKTVANVVGSLAVFLNFAVKRKWINASPMAAADLPKQSADALIDELTFLEPYEVDRLIDASQPGQYELLDRALYTLAAYSGLRQGELRGLKWQHIDFQRSLVHVLDNVTRTRRSSPKGKRRRRVPLAPTAAEALEALRSASRWTAPEAPVFAAPATGSPMALTPLMKRYRLALVAAGLPEQFSFHDLRHTFGTTMARAGVPVSTIQAWMGHADLQTTQIYMHYAPAQEDAARIDAAFGRG